MISSIFEAWVRRFDIRMQSENRKVLLLVDNCPAHSVIEGLKAVTVEYFPPNVTSVLQPLDQGIIRNFKMHYRQRVLQQMIQTLDNGAENEVIHILQALRFCKSAWAAVSSECIANCFKHAFKSQSTDSSQAPPQDSATLDSMLKEAGAEICADDFIHADDSLEIAAIMADEGK